MTNLSSKFGQLFSFSFLILITHSCQPTNDPNKKEWIQLFNGKDLSGWKVKITGHNLNDNFGNTFRIEEGLLKVRYDQYDSFRSQFGHIFYDKKFSHYLLAVEYRFTGEQCKGGPDWAKRNSGAMLHCQDPATMGKDQDFPISIEAQLLGGLGNGTRSQQPIYVLQEQMFTLQTHYSLLTAFHPNQKPTMAINGCEQSSWF